MKSLANYKMPRSPVENKVVNITSSKNIDISFKNKNYGNNLSLPHKENKFLEKIKREEANTTRESFKDLDMVQQELNLMNLKVLSTIKRKKLKP